jgi:hypothetical protein
MPAIRRPVAKGQVRHIEARQYLGAVDLDHLRQALIGKWGTPTSDHGSLLQWIGTDGASPLVVKINATISVDDRGTTVLGVDIAPMPAARKPAAPAGVGLQL